MLTVEGYICLLHAKSSTRESPTGAGRIGFVNPQRLILKEELRMKKVLSLVLAFAMILGSFGFVFANEFPDVKDSAYYGEAVNVLSSLDVIGGFPDGTFGPEKEVTRAQMATMIVNALGMTVSGQSDTKFSDVSKSHWASGFIAYATSVGFVAGYPDGTFKPDAQVTYDQALTMIVAALGYKAESLPGTWPGNFVNKAQGLGILDTCKTTGTTNAPRQDIACFLYDALDCAIGYTDKDGTWHANDANGDGVGDDDMYGRLGAVNYRTATELDGSFIVTGEEKSDLNLQKYLGAFVTAKAASSERDKIVAVAEVKSEFIEGSFNTARTKFTTTDDVAYKIDTTATSTVEYGTGTGESLPFVTFTNGDYDNPSSFTLATAPTGVKLVMAVSLSGSRITKVYSIQVWDTAANAGAGSFMLEDDIQESIKDDQKVGNYDLPMTDDDEIDTAAFTVVGDKTSLDDLAEDDVVTVYLNSDNKIARIEVSTKTIEGTVTKISADPLPDTEFTIAGEAYCLNGDSPKTVANFTTLMNGETEAKFYLDYAGDIFDYEELSDAATYFAVLLDKGVETDKYSNTTNYAKLFLEDGTVKEFEVDSALAAKPVYTGLASGALVEYTVDDDVLVDIAAKDSGTTTPSKFDDNGVYGTNALTDKTVVFSYSGVLAPSDGGEADKDNWSVIEVATLKGCNFNTLDWLVDSGKYEAVLVSGVTGQTAAYAIFVSADGTAKGGELFTALYEGKVQSVTAQTGKITATELYTTAASIQAFKLTKNSNDVITAIPGHASNPLTPTVAAVTSGGKAKAVAISGTLFTDAAGANFTMDKDAYVYIYDVSDKKWTAGSLSSMTGKTYTGIFLYKLGTGDYDLVLMIKD